MGGSGLFLRGRPGDSGGAHHESRLGSACNPRRAAGSDWEGRERTRSFGAYCGAARRGAGAHPRSSDQLARGPGRSRRQRSLMAIAETLIRSCVLVVAAHPDDETIGAGGLLGHLHDPYILHVTDGAPRNLEFARAAGFQTRAQYARARQEELASALRLAGISASRWLSLGITDQTASLDLAGLVHRLLRLLRTIVPQAVLSHAYEGGHPDHDATAFAIHAACRLLPSPPRIYEFTSYHAARPPLAMESGRFLVGQETAAITALDESDQRRKS